MPEYILICGFVIALIVSIVLLIFVFYQVPSTEQKIMQVIVLANWLVTFGNIINVTLPEEKGAALGDIIMYIGGSFITFAYFLLCSTICKISVKRRFSIAILFVNLLIVAAVVFDNRLHFIYKEISYYRSGPITYSIYTYGWMFYVYLVWQCMYIVAIAGMLLHCRKITPLLFKHLKPSLVKFLLCGVIAYIPYLLITFFNMEAEVIGISCTFATTLFVRTVNKNKIFPIRVNSQDCIINELDDILLVTTVEGGFEYANSKAKKLVEGLEFFPYGMKIEGMDSLVDSMIALEEDQTLVVEGRIYRKKTLPFEYRGRQLGNIYWLRDETVLTNYVKEIVQLKDEADHANEAKSTFLAHMSHEIRTPINGVLGLDEMLIREAKEPQTLEYANQIMRTGKTLLAIVNDVLDFSKIEAGKMVIVESAYYSRRMFDDLILAVEIRADEKGLAVEKEISDRIPEGLMGDETRVKQIVTNLMTNAVKYTEKGRVVLKADYFEAGADNPEYPEEPEELKQRRRLFVSVSDTGIGIKDEDMEKLYGSFERIENMTTHKTEGTGLGMSITIKLLKLMGGQLRVRSEYGKGSVFSVSIPQEPAQMADCLCGNDEDNKRKEALFIAPDADILVVDDNKTNLVVAKGLLKRTLVNVELSSSGPDCLEKIRKKHYDIILLDHRMPDMDGIETFNRMQEMDHLCKGVPIVMMTAEADSGAKDYYLGLGMTEYISKPLNALLYESMIARLLPKEKVTYSDRSR